jgi:hypothetical protein
MSKKDPSNTLAIELVGERKTKHLTFTLDVKVVEEFHRLEKLGRGATPTIDVRETVERLLVAGIKNIGEQLRDMRGTQEEKNVPETRNNHSGTRNPTV